MPNTPLVRALMIAVLIAALIVLCIVISGHVNVN